MLIIPQTGQRGFLKLLQGLCSDARAFVLDMSVLSCLDKHSI